MAYWSSRCLPGCLLLLALPAWAVTPDFQQLCEQRLPPPSLVVKRSESGYRVDTTLSYRELTGMGADLLQHGKHNVLGITRAETAAMVEMKLARLDDESGGQECLSPQVVITIEYKPIKVYIGREFLPGTCTYREILLHEMRHVQTYQYHLPRIQSAVRVQLARRFSSRIVYGEPGALESRLKAEIYDNWLPIVDLEIRKVNAAQAQIDTAEEYERMENVCDGEVQRLLGLGV